MVISIRPITTADVSAYRDVRLRALRDAPGAFGSTYARESQFTDAQWGERAHNLDGERAAGFLAFDGESPCGIAAGFIDPEDAARAHLVSMWVAPDHRGGGVADALVEAVASWAASRGVRTLRLNVTANNDRAIGFYRRIGFTLTGETEPYPNDPALFEHVMEREISRVKREGLGR